jgi:hypothetical protein
LTDHPLKADQARQDTFDLYYRVGPIYDIIRHKDTQTPMTIAIYGDWGTGKTSAMRWLEGLLEVWNQSPGKEGVKVWPVWFYPWKYDSKQDVWRGLISEVIIASIDVKQVTWQKAKTAAKQFGLFLGKGFLHALASIKFKGGVPGTGVEAEADPAFLKDILAEYGQTAHPEKAYLNEFEVSLGVWIKSTLGKNERMVLFIDDLDRCLPDVALQVLEALKLYLNIDKLIFVVGVDKEVVDRLIVEHYRKLGLVCERPKEDNKDKTGTPSSDLQRKRDEEKAKSYLAKMFQVDVHLLPSEDQIERLLDESLETIPYWKALSDMEKDIFRRLIAKEAHKNPREVKRLINSALIGGVGALMLSGGDT